MQKSAVRVIGIVYGVLLAMMYLAHHPPQWVEAVTISTEGVRAVTIFGHRVEVRLVVEKPTEQVLPRIVRAIDLRRGDGAADLVCAPVPTTLHPMRGR